jgi:hypothetical protein
VEVILRIIVGARRPLTVQEMAMALGWQHPAMRQPQVKQAWIFMD